MSFVEYSTTASGNVAAILGLGRVNLKHLIMLRKINFTDICTHQITACCETFSEHFCYAMEMNW